MTAVVFTNPADASTYSWPFNPTDEQPLSKARQIDRTSNTGNVGATKQQGDDGPLILDWTVDVRTSAMELALWQWYVLCRTQTIYVTDWDGEQYEGQIIAMSRQRQKANPQYAIFQLQFEIYRLISGTLYTAGVLP